MTPFDKHYDRWQDFPAGQYWKWRNFSPAEVACRDGSLRVNEDAMDRLQALRNAIGKPMIVTSAYRSVSHNRKVGGAERSKHLLAKAFDIRMDNHDPLEFEFAAREAGFLGFGYYPKQGFMHIDTGPARSWGTPFPPREHRFQADERPSSDGTVGDAAPPVALGAVVAAVAQSGAPWWMWTGLAVACAVVLAGWLLRERIVRWLKEEDI